MDFPHHPLTGNAMMALGELGRYQIFVKNTFMKTPGTFQHKWWIKIYWENIPISLDWEGVMNAMMPQGELGRYQIFVKKTFMKRKDHQGLFSTNGWITIYLEDTPISLDWEGVMNAMMALGDLGRYQISVKNTFMKTQDHQGLSSTNGWIKIHLDDTPISLDWEGVINAMIALGDLVDTKYLSKIHLWRHRITRDFPAQMGE